MEMFAFLIDPWQRQAGVSVFGWGVDRASVADRVTVGFSLLACPLQGLMQTFEIFYPLPIFYWVVLPKPIFFFSPRDGVIRPFLEDPARIGMPSMNQEIFFPSQFARSLVPIIPSTSLVCIDDSLTAHFLHEPARNHLLSYHAGPILTWTVMLSLAL